ncbi:MAG: sensor histidine kinase, partial [Cellulosilyticaceae bacterium]
IEYISYCLTEISKGNLHYKVEVVGEDELAQVATDIAHMEREIRNQIEAQKQAEKVKNELITNVAHDLRTPLTSIIGYMGLLRDARYTDEEERAKYTEIAYQKAEKLKGLIEDLFEYTKLHNQEATLKMQPLSLTHLINQLAEELMPLGEERGIVIRTHIQTEQTRINGDVQKLMRAFENLIGNAIKYSVPCEEVHIYVLEANEHVIVSIQNKCEHMPEDDLSKLFDRFYRTDASRNSETGGSGLGLAIAKNIVMLHGGEIWAEAKDQVISFNMKLRR